MRSPSYALRRNRNPISVTSSIRHFSGTNFGEANRYDVAFYWTRKAGGSVADVDCKANGEDIKQEASSSGVIEMLTSSSGEYVGEVKNGQPHGEGTIY